MVDKESYDLAKYRLEKANECIKHMEILAEAGGYTAAANRAYYAIFHSVRAVLALDKVDRKNILA